MFLSRNSSVAFGAAMPDAVMMLVCISGRIRFQRFQKKIEAEARSTPTAGLKLAKAGDGCGIPPQWCPPAAQGDRGGVGRAWKWGGRRRGAGGGTALGCLDRSLSTIFEGFFKRKTREILFQFQYHTLGERRARPPQALSFA